MRMVAAQQSEGWGWRAGWLVVALLCSSVAVFSYRYLPRIGPMSPEILRNMFARPWLDVHVAGAATALLCAPLQLLRGLRRRLPCVHRWVGRSYAAGCLVGGVGGFVMAFGSTAGPIATVGFGSLAVMWVTVTAQAWRLALRRRFAEHGAWMLRSFAMTFAAVVLRLGLPVAPALGLPFVDGYRALSFLSWIPSLVLIELWLRRRRRVASLIDAPTRASAPWVGGSQPGTAA